MGKIRKTGGKLVRISKVLWKDGEKTPMNCWERWFPPHFPPFSVSPNVPQANCREAYRPVNWEVLVLAGAPGAPEGHLTEGESHVKEMGVLRDLDLNSVPMVPPGKELQDLSRLVVGTHPTQPNPTPLRTPKSSSMRLGVDIQTGRPP